MDGKTLIHIQRKNKDICILLKEGEILSLENIVDVWVSDQPERSKREDSWKDRSLTNSQYEQFMKDTNEYMKCGALNSQETD